MHFPVNLDQNFPVKPRHIEIISSCTRQHATLRKIICEEKLKRYYFSNFNVIVFFQKC